MGRKKGGWCGGMENHDCSEYRDSRFFENRRLQDKEVRCMTGSPGESQKKGHEDILQPRRSSLPDSMGDLRFKIGVLLQMQSDWIRLVLSKDFEKSFKGKAFKRKESCR